jgi:LmbE family N-acetylglucosaminyl deacetylase
LLKPALIGLFVGAGITLLGVALGSSEWTTLQLVVSVAAVGASGLTFALFATSRTLMTPPRVGPVWASRDPRIASKERAGYAPELGDEIGKCYDEVAALAATQASRTQAPASGLEERMAAAWEKLRALQREEARRFRRAFEASLAMPLDAGAQIVERAQALRSEIEDLASED